MPEAAEVETVRRQLTGLLPFTIQAVDVRHPQVVRRHDPVLLQTLVGREVVGVSRRGKWLRLECPDSLFCFIHLRMSGRLLWDPPTEPKHSHVIFSVVRTNAHTLLFTDPRRFGEVVIHPFAEFSTVTDVLDPALSQLPWPNSKRPIKSVLLDQNVLIQGLGNYLTDELCHRIGVNPLTPCCEVYPSDVSKLYATLPSLIDEFAAARGTSLADESWTDIYGQLGDGADLLQVHTQQICKSCLYQVTKVRVSGRSTYFCQRCQPHSQRS